MFSLLVGCKSTDSGSSNEPIGHGPPAPSGGPATGTDTPAQPGTDPSAHDEGNGAEVPTVPAVQLIGRFDTRDPAGARCGWPGCRIVARFDGTRVSVRLREELQPWMDGGPSEWDVAIDGQWQPKLVTNATGTPTEHVIADGLAAGTHVVELFKRSDAQNGTTQFLGYDFGAGKLLPPPPRKTRRIEIIGDSVSSGYGVEGVGLVPACPAPAYAAKYQNFHKSMGARLGEMFGAEVAGTVFSGKGVAKNVSPADKETMPVIFDRALPDDGNSTWSFQSFVADVVVVMLGGNDFGLGEPVDEGPATPSEFLNAYTAFALALRQKYPGAHLFLTVPPPLSDLDPPGRNVRTNVVAGVKAVTAARNAAGDPKVYPFEPAPGDPSEHTGCEGHGSPQFHQRVAAEVAAQVTAKVGWKLISP
jgi:lysophospholipase L1-like esterase